VGVGGGTLEIAPSEESLDKFTRLSGISNFTDCSRGSWTLDISEGCNTRSVDASMRAAWIQINESRHIKASAFLSWRKAWGGYSG
jgi:hypothetical protein